jgi:LacI family transcriptional regulator
MSDSSGVRAVSAESPVEERVTIATVARAAGVSVATVSKVLSGRHPVHPATRGRVEEALAATGYRRKDRSERAGLVDFLIGEVDSAWAIELLRGAEHEAHRLGASLVLTIRGDREHQPREWVKSLVSHQTDGVVLVLGPGATEAVDQLLGLAVPLVVLDQVGGFDRNVPTIGATNFAGGLAATQHLAELGHTRIGVITGPEAVLSQERLDGYRVALSRAGLPFDESLCRRGDFYAEGGRSAAAELLALPRPPTAIFAGNDQQARGVYQAARERGLRIPDDLSVVGFDDVEACEWMTPTLTTVRQPLAQMAAMAVRHLLQRPNTLSEEPLRLELSTTLIVRDSTATASPG